MTVKELREALKGFDENTPVTVVYNEDPVERESVLTVDLGVDDDDNAVVELWVV